jgi:hypothetical protein
VSVKADNAARAAEVRRLARAAAGGQFGRDGLVDIVIALQDFAALLEDGTVRGRRRTPEETRHRIGLALAWLQQRHGNLKVKQRKAIVEQVLNVKPRALTTLAPSHRHVTSDSLARWRRTTEGARVADALDKGAEREHAKRKRLRD